MIGSQKQKKLILLDTKMKFYELYNLRNYSMISVSIFFESIKNGEKFIFWFWIGIQYILNLILNLIVFKKHLSIKYNLFKYKKLSIMARDFSEASDLITKK